jgi:chromosome segregation ATPase
MILLVIIIIIMQILIHNELFQIKRKVRIIMANQEDLRIQIEALTAQVVKIQTETQSLLTRIEELLAIINAGGTVTPELQAAVDALVAQVAIVDELVPDAG